MKKILLFIILLIPFIVYGESCNQDDIVIDNFTMTDLNGSVREKVDGFAEGKTINLNLNLYDVGDYAEYSFTIKNVSSSDYYFDENSLISGSNYVDYEFVYDDDSSVIKAGEEKNVKLKVIYKNQVPSDLLVGGVLDDSNILSLNLSNRELIDFVVNPNTKDLIIICFVILIIFGILLFFLIKNRKSFKPLLLIIGLFVFIPIYAYAICRCEIEVDSKIFIKDKDAEFDVGYTVNNKIRSLINYDDFDYYADHAFKRSTTLPDSVKELADSCTFDDTVDEQEFEEFLNNNYYDIYYYIVRLGGVDDNGETIYLSIDSLYGTILEEFTLSSLTEDIIKDKELYFKNYFSDAFTFEFYDTGEFLYFVYDEDSKRLVQVSEDEQQDFINKKLLEKYLEEKNSCSNLINSKDSFYDIYVWYDESNQDLYYYTDSEILYLNENAISTFANLYDFSDFTDLKYVNTSRVKNMHSIFAGDYKFTDFSFLEDWDTSNVVNMNNMFSGTGLTNLDFLANWDISNLKNMYSMFNYASNLVDISALSNWDISNVEDIAWIFCGTDIDSVDAVKDWDISNVKDISGVFDHTYISSIVNLSGWNTSNVTKMIATFRNNRLLNLDGIENWDTSNVIDMDDLFGNSEIIDISAISGWDVSKVQNMHALFRGARQLTSLDAIAGWNTKSVLNMEQAFGDMSLLTSTSFIADWDTSNVVDIDVIFSGCSSLTDVSGLEDFEVDSVKFARSIFSDSGISDFTAIKDWKLSNVVDYTNMFNKTKITNLDFLENWDVSNAENIRYMFGNCKNLIDISGIANWNVSNVTDMSGLFFDSKNISNSNVINDWDIRKVTNFQNMFKNVNNKPNFTQVQGTWSYDGTFIPDNS